MPEPRYAYVYDTVFRFLYENHIDRLAPSVRQIASKLGIKIHTVTDICARSGLTQEEILTLCGNPDGAVFACQRTQRCKLCHAIVVNDTVHLSERMRFTIAEECAHVLLGHTQDARFDYNAPDYDEAVYQAYEIEARTAAGLLIVSPRALSICQRRGILNPSMVSALCKVSHACARARIDHFARNLPEMQKSPYYEKLRISPWDLTYNLPKNTPRLAARNFKPKYPNIYSDAP